VVGVNDLVSFDPQPSSSEIQRELEHVDYKLIRAMNLSAVYRTVAVAFLHQQRRRYL
jgi:hypothetical protein